MSLKTSKGKFLSEICADSIPAGYESELEELHIFEILTKIENIKSLSIGLIRKDLIEKLKRHSKLSLSPTQIGHRPEIQKLLPEIIALTIKLQESIEEYEILQNSENKAQLRHSENRKDSRIILITTVILSIISIIVTILTSKK